MRLHTHIQGSGFPILCLHGHPGSGEAMSVFTDPLTSVNAQPAQFKTYAPDLRGYGRSRTSYPFEMTCHIDDLEALIAQHQIKKALVLGWSLGGILALELALRRPDIVRGLILVGTAARPVGSHPPITWQDNLLTGIAGGLNLALPNQKLVRALGQKSLFRYLIYQHTPLAYRYLAKQGAPAYWRTSRHAETALFSAIRAGYNRVPEVKTLTIPALMLCGECDHHITAASSLETARALPNCEAHCYPNTAHLFPWEIPEQMNADICQWLTAHANIWQQ
ncbi:MAG: alpha/beta hydrolase [Phormidesmis sp.]